MMRINFFMCFLMLNIMVHAQSMCNDQLDTNHWFYKWMHAGEDRDEQRLLKVNCNNLLPSDLTFSTDRIDSTRFEDDDYLMDLESRIHLNGFAFALEMLGEMPVYQDSSEIVRLFQMMHKGIEIYTVHLVDNQTFISYKFFDGLEMIQECKTFPEIEFDHLKSQIVSSDIMEASNFLEDELIKKDLEFVVMDGSDFLLEMQIDCKYHLVTLDNLFTYFPEYGAIKRWFDGRFDE